MATTTKNYGLVKPDASDLYDIGVFNDNMDKIDGALSDSGKITYNTVETATGNRWIDGKMIYRKTINCGKFTNDKTVYTGLTFSDVDAVIDIRGVGYTKTSTSYFAFPIVYSQNDANTTYNTCYLSGNSSTNSGEMWLKLYKGSGYGDMANSHVTIEYTKTNN